MHPDPNNPVVIKMWKLQGGEHLVHFQTEIHVPIDGSPVDLDLQTGQALHNGGDLIIKVKTTPTPNIRQRYDWQATIQSIAGGLISSSQDFERMLQAPDTGYDSEFDIAYLKDVKPWSTTFNGSFLFFVSEWKLLRQTRNRGTERCCKKRNSARDFKQLC